MPLSSVQYQELAERLKQQQVGKIKLGERPNMFMGQSTNDLKPLLKNKKRSLFGLIFAMGFVKIISIIKRNKEKQEIECFFLTITLIRCYLKLGKEVVATKNLKGLSEDLEPSSNKLV